MKEKYLPIGTIVKVKTLNKMIMIVGYYSLDYSNSIKIFDYEGYAYPEGTLLKNNSFSFNHNNIEEVLFMGLENNDYINLNKKLNNQQDINTEKMASIKIKFGKNEVLESKESENIKTNKPIINNNFVFDENGFVIDEPKIVKQIGENYEFMPGENEVTTDEITVEAQLTDYPKLQKSNYIYEFDENGIVTAVKEASVKKEEPADSVISLDSGKTIAPAAPIVPEPEEFVMPHYEFDENGIIINN